LTTSGADGARRTRTMNERIAFMDLNNVILCADCASELDEGYVTEVSISPNLRPLECGECGATV
jgi:hypothetical protein